MAAIGSEYFRGIRPGLIEAVMEIGRVTLSERYFRGIRPGLIEAPCGGEGSGAAQSISGASAPASLKPDVEAISRKRPLRIAGASAPASLKPQGDDLLRHPVAAYFRGIRPGLIEAT